MYAGLLIKDIKHIDKFKLSINSTSPIKKINNKDIYYINIYNKKFCEFLIKQGCIPRKTYNIIFPDLKYDLIRHFIRGFFDGDGSITCTEKTLQMTICCAVYEFLLKMINILYNELKLDRKFNLYKNNKNLNIWGKCFT